MTTNKQTEEGKPKLSRQRLWQIKQREKGNCVICGKPRVTASHCEHHAAEHAAREKKRAQAAVSSVTL